MPLDQLRRREFITPLGGAAAAWPLDVNAQTPPKMLRVGVLSGNQRTSDFRVAFDQRQSHDDEGAHDLDEANSNP
jgi:hypothetical protein